MTRHPLRNIYRVPEMPSTIRSTAVSPENHLRNTVVGHRIPVSVNPVGSRITSRAGDVLPLPVRCVLT